MSTPLNVVIVGAGVGGLSAAAGLARNGHKVTVFERTTHVEGVGYAFRITPNSDLCLRDLGIDSIAGGATVANRTYQRNALGEVVAEQRETQGTGKQGSSVFAYRPQVHQQLSQTASRYGASIELGVAVSSVDADTSTLKLESGRKVQADLIIGADGVNSFVRSSVLDTSLHYPKATTGKNAFRFMLDSKTVEGDDILGPLYQGESKDSNTINIWMSLQGKMLLSYPVDYGRQINVVCTHPEANSDLRDGLQAGNDYNHKVPVETVLSIYKDFEPRARRFLELADPNGFCAWKLMDMDEIPTWSKNSTVLLGDAAHAVLPFGFSGASMALEDSTVLSNLLPQGVDKSELQTRLKAWEKIRRLRVAKVRDASRQIGSGQYGPGQMKEYNMFLSSYDAVGEARRKEAEIQGS